MRSPLSSGSFCRPTTNGSPSVSQAREAADVVDGERRRWSRPCSSAGSARPTRSPARGPAARRGARPARRAARRPTCGWRPRPRARARGSRGRAGRRRRGRGSAPARGRPRRARGGESTASVSKRSRNSVEQALQQVAVVARARQRDDQRRAARVGVAAAEQPHLLALQREQRHDRAAQVVGRGGEQLVLRERVEQRDRGLVVVRALDQVLGAQDLAQLAVQQRRLARGLGCRPWW